MSKQSAINIDYFKTLLLRRRTELKDAVASTTELREPVELDQTRQGRLSRQDALMQQEMAKELDRRRKLEIERIELALKRIDCDDYGYCIKCDEQIAIKRLELDPSFPHCIKCATGISVG